RVSYCAASSLGTSWVPTPAAMKARRRASASAKIARLVRFLEEVSMDIDARMHYKIWLLLEEVNCPDAQGASIVERSAAARELSSPEQPGSSAPTCANSSCARDSKSSASTTS